jgi:hypothetical protein
VRDAGRHVSGRPEADPKGFCSDVGGVLLPTTWELLEAFEVRTGRPSGTTGAVSGSSSGDRDLIDA